MADAVGKSSRAESQRKLLAFLRERTHDATSFSAEELAQATGYSPASIRTYIGKKLKPAHLVEAADGDRLVAKLPSSFSESDFRRLMSQVSDSVASLSSASDWVYALHKLLHDGEQRGFRLTAEEGAALVDRLRRLTVVS